MEADIKGYVIGSGTDVRIRQDFTAAAGSIWTINYVIRNPDGSPFDLTAATLQFVISDSSGNSVSTLTPVIGSPASAGLASLVIGSGSTFPLGPLTGYDPLIYNHITKLTNGSLTGYQIYQLSRLTVSTAAGQPVQPTAPTSFTIVNVSASYAARFQDFVVADPTLGSFAITLPLTSAATLIGNGVVIRNDSTSANIVTVTPSGSDTIAGLSPWPLSSNESLTLMARSGRWMPW